MIFVKVDNYQRFGLDDVKIIQGHLLTYLPSGDRFFPHGHGGVFFISEIDNPENITIIPAQSDHRIFSVE